MSIQKDSDNVPEQVNPVKKHPLHRNQELYNPCYKEHLLSLKCLDSNQKERQACEVYFKNYKNCKQFWAKVQSERKSKGIKPYMPPLEERKKIKAEFLNSR
ncbi:Coiled-coil-helix-coiled-coil-helix domain-containing protein 7 [Camponotus floridanus]|uniref:Coiled-coil-helix-coiled-coil-helix domain-containing protein 7 n=1 Tax=Camponotus floridanus TaxID=104421 RepID=E2AHR3_CAMFO|nr:coiled-coil-helix-coiled-coil-helix domain-containing protein 7 [Camponotus floridanus]EFN67043.1 Coiled-coil-helix-coiled-coil-helix domain-containing protein 7 [Camponotus floridanus]